MGALYSRRQTTIVVDMDETGELEPDDLTVLSVYTEEGLLWKESYPAIVDPDDQNPTYTFRMVRQYTVFFR